MSRERPGNILARTRAPRKKRAKRNHWVFTSYEEKFQPQFDADVVRYCVYQKEICPDTKNEHYQGYIEFFDPKRLTQVKQALGECHADGRLGSRTEARLYCMKKKTAVPNTIVEFGVWREETNRKRKLKEMLLTDMSLDDLIDVAPHEFVRHHRGLIALYNRRKKKKAKQFRHVETLVFYGPTGCGKTRRACSFPDHFKLPIGDKLWFGAYDNESVLIIDDFDGHIAHNKLLQILDGYELQCPVKGGFVWANWTTVIITSNTPPRDWYPHGLSAPLARRLTKITNFEEE